MKITTTEYGTPETILFHPDGYAGFAQTFPSNDPRAVTVDGHKVIKAGTIWPANDATARGVVFQEVNVDQGGTGSVLYVADINLDRLPVAPSVAAQHALPSVKWFKANGTSGAEPFTPDLLV
jgi:hypothetical protein